MTPLQLVPDPPYGRPGQPPPCPTWNGVPVTWEPWRREDDDGPIFICGPIAAATCSECGVPLRAMLGWSARGVVADKTVTVWVGDRRLVRSAGPADCLAYASMCQCGALALGCIGHTDEGVTLICDGCDQSVAGGATHDEAVAHLIASGGQHHDDVDHCRTCVARALAGDIPVGRGNLEQQGRTLFGDDWDD